MVQQISNLDEALAQDANLAAALNGKTYELLMEAGYEEAALAPLIAPRVADREIPPYRFPDLAAKEEEAVE